MTEPLSDDARCLLSHRIDLHAPDILLAEFANTIYDCLYLACAEAAAAVLVTADRRFARKIAEQSSNIDVRYLGEAGTAEWIEAAATGPRGRTP